MDSEQDIGPTFILGLSALLLSAFFIARHVYLSNHPLDAELTAKVTTSQRTLVEASPEVAPPVDPAAQRQVLGHVFECVVNGRRVFSDSRCAPDAKSREIKQSNTMPAPEFVYSPGVDLHGPVRVDNGEDEAPTVNKKKCAYLEESIERLDERMRHGYNSIEGERLHEEYRVVSGQLDDCKRH